MKRLSIRARITLWFSAALVLAAALTSFLVLSADRKIIRKGIQDNLIEAVENNVDEIEFYLPAEAVNPDRDADLFIVYKNGFLEIDDDYLNEVNQVSTALYDADGSLLYGQNPIMRATAAIAFQDSKVQSQTFKGVLYYIYDRALIADGLDGLWLRGVVPETQGNVQFGELSRITMTILPLLVLAAIIGGYLIAGRLLRPIRDVSKAAEEITRDGDLNRRIETRPGKDEVRQLAGNFNQMLDRLETSFEKERQFTSDVSHELRTPTSVILAQCEYALDKPQSEEEYVRALETVERQGRKMSRLINEMLDFSRLERKSDRYPIAEVDLSALVRSVCEDMALIQEKGITLSADVADSIRVSGNSNLLSRMLSNLIGNAYRYGREHGTIQVKLEADANEALLSVADDGIGISEDDQKKIFDRFYQADPSRSDEGSGLGLSMAAEIARFHGGRLSVESAPGEGSVFAFRMKKIK